jgi:DegV family protein with EDD domain
MKVSFGQESFRDGVDLTPAQFYERLATSKALPTTASPSAGDFLQAFQNAAAQGMTAVLCLTVARDLSSTYQAAALAADQAKKDVPSLNFQVMDTRTAGGAQALLALAAARAAQEGSNLPAVAAEVSDLLPRVHFLGLVDTLYYIWKGGRIPRAALWATTLLQIKPILEIKDGKVPMLERPRTRARALERLTAIVTDRAAGKPLRAIVMHANAPGEADALLARLAARVQFAEVFTAPFTPVIGAHTGPGLLGVAFHTV